MRRKQESKKTENKQPQERKELQIKSMVSGWQQQPAEGHPQPQQLIPKKKDFYQFMKIAANKNMFKKPFR